MKGDSWITESTKSVWKSFSLANSHQKFVLELWQNLKKWRRSLNESTKHIGKYLSTSARTRKIKVPFNGAFLQMHIKKRSFGWNQTFVVQVELSSKPCYRTLKLVSRYFKPKPFSKSPTSWMSQLIWLYSSERNYISKLKFWTSAKTTSGKKLFVD